VYRQFGRQLSLLSPDRGMGLGVEGLGRQDIIRYLQRGHRWQWPVSRSWNRGKVHWHGYRVGRSESLRV